MTLLNLNKIERNESIEAQVLNQLQESCTAFDCEADVANYFSSFEDFEGTWTTNKVESHILYGESAMDVDYIIEVFENYIDAGSDDYVYTFNVEER